MRARTPLATLAALALLAAPAVAIAAGPGQPSAPPSPVQSDWPNQGRLGEAAEKVEALAQSRYTDIYAGVRLDLPGDRVIVHRKPTSEFDRAITELLPGTTVTFVHASHSERQLLAWAQEVASDQSYWQRRGVPLHGIGPRVGLCVTVTIDNPTRDEDALITHYADMPICVEEGGPSVPLGGA